MDQPTLKRGPHTDRLKPTVSPALTSSVNGWRACGAFDDRYKVVRDYQRLAHFTGMERNYARLYCGMTEGDKETGESAFGFRHIKNEHEHEWTIRAGKMGRQWRDLVAWMIDWTTYDPDVEGRFYTRVCFSRKFVFVADGEVLWRTRAVLWLGQTGVRIITFYGRRTNAYNPCTRDAIDTYP